MSLETELAAAALEVYDTARAKGVTMLDFNIFMVLSRGTAQLRVCIGCNGMNNVEAPDLTSALAEFKRRLDWEQSVRQTAQPLSLTKD